MSGVIHTLNRPSALILNINTCGIRLDQSDDWTGRNCCMNIIKVPFNSTTETHAYTGLVLLHVYTSHFHSVRYSFSSSCSHMMFGHCICDHMMPFDSVASDQYGTTLMMMMMMERKTIVKLSDVRANHFASLTNDLHIHLKM